MILELISKFCCVVIYVFFINIFFGEKIVFVISGLWWIMLIIVNSEELKIKM